jgi:hypothetical protein
VSGGDDALISHGDRLAQAVRWLAQQERDDHAVVEEACRRFDLSPVDEEFLQRMWRRRQASRSSGQSSP